MDLLDRIAQKIEIQEDGCWHWTAFVDPRGYGYGNFGPGNSGLAHRGVWQLVVGPVSEGLELDHLCRNPSCVNPDHLEPVTHLENMRRSPIPSAAAAFQLAKTHCPQSHEYTPENTIGNGRNNNTRRCRTCHNQRERDRKRRS